MGGEESGGFDATPWYVCEVEMPLIYIVGMANDFSQDTGEPVLLPFRMSCFVLSNLVVTAGMLTPGLQVCLVAYRAIYTYDIADKVLLDDRNAAMANHQSVAQCSH